MGLLVSRVGWGCWYKYRLMTNNLVINILNFLRCDQLISPPDQKNVVFFTIKTDNVRVSADAVCRITGTKNGSCKIVAATLSGSGVSIQFTDHVTCLL